ncbi:MAG: DUF1540 domain-containing protein [Clostridia bacterium]|nr:DUF1540 domain-containing protein [Clostridia bacterium]
MEGIKLGTSYEDGKPIKGISCAVKNCEYHDGECTCTAGKISVGPSTACCCSDTVCATFKMRDAE